MTEEQYILSHGGDDLIGQSIFMQRSAASQKTDFAAADTLNKKMGQIVETNRDLRREFRQKVESGEIHEDTVLERLQQASKGHPDNEATSAAQRCLEKREIYERANN